MKVIPLARLRGACSEQMEKVRGEWPKGIPVMIRNVYRAQNLILNLDWLVDRLFRTDEEFRVKYREIDPKHPHDAPVGGAGCPGCRRDARLLVKAILALPERKPRKKVKR